VADSILTVEDVGSTAWSALKGAVMPVVEPAWASAPFWCRPLTLTKVTYIQPNAVWSTILTYTIPPNHAAVVTSVIATRIGSMTSGTLRFRLLFGNATCDSVDFGVGMDQFKTGATSYPAIDRPIKAQTDRNNAIQLQARNLSGVAGTQAIVGLFGYIYAINTDRGVGSHSGVVDSL
jgi:hypothetical protein